MSAALTRPERDALLKMVRQRERVAKSAAADRSAQLLAEFEAQLDRRYHYDEDAVWKMAVEAADAAVRQAQAQVEARCAELGIPAQFAPRFSAAWYDRGRNALTSERAEMRRLAKRRIEQIEQRARLDIEQASLAAQEKLMGTGLTSEAAQAFLAEMPTVDRLMPSLALEDVQAALSAPKRLGRGTLEAAGALDENGQRRAVE